MKDYKIRKVKVLDNELLELAKKRGYNDDDLVIVETVIKHNIIKIEGSPSRFLVKRILNSNGSKVCKICEETFNEEEMLGDLCEGCWKCAKL